MIKNFNKHMIKEIEGIVKDFDWKRVSWQDREYLTSLIHETLNSRNFRAKGGSFADQYPQAGEYALFNCIKAVNRYREEFYSTDYASSHLLAPHPKGRKYYFVWCYSK